VPSQPASVRVARAGNHQISPHTSPAHVRIPQTRLGVLIISNKSLIKLSCHLLDARSDSNTTAICSGERMAPLILMFCKKSGRDSVSPERNDVIYHVRLSKLRVLSASVFSKCSSVQSRSVSSGNKRLSSLHSVHLTSIIRSLGLPVILSNVVLSLSVAPV